MLPPKKQVRQRPRMSITAAGPRAVAGNVLLRRVEMSGSSGPHESVAPGALVATQRPRTELDRTDLLDDDMLGVCADEWMKMSGGPVAVYCWFLAWSAPWLLPWVARQFPAVGLAPMFVLWIAQVGIAAYLFTHRRRSVRKLARDLGASSAVAGEIARAFPRFLPPRPGRQVDRRRLAGETRAAYRIRLREIAVNDLVVVARSNLDELLVQQRALIDSGAKR